MNAPASARARARADVSAAILASARRQLAEVGAAGLSLRAVARDLGMVSSAVYRYFPSRDHLLTRLIVEAFDGLGTAAETASGKACRAGASPGERWLAVARAVREWSLAHPHEHALVFGSPVPGYHAPRDTVAPALRIPAVLADVLVEAAMGGTLRPPDRPLPGQSLASESTAAMVGRPPAPYDDLLERALLVWTSLVGTISSELFGHIDAADEAAYFDRAVAMTALIAGLVIELDGN